MKNKTNWLFPILGKSVQSFLQTLITEVVCKMPEDKRIFIMQTISDKKMPPEEKMAIILSEINLMLIKEGSKDEVDNKSGKSKMV